MCWLSSYDSYYKVMSPNLKISCYMYIHVFVLLFFHQKCSPPMWPKWTLLELRSMKDTYAHSRSERFKIHLQKAHLATFPSLQVFSSFPFPLVSRNRLSEICCRASLPNACTFLASDPTEISLPWDETVCCFHL
jgi:hypothetical protein